ncbi:unnamed protein product, partial [Polarella glacialis]
EEVEDYMKAPLPVVVPVVKKAAVAPPSAAAPLPSRANIMNPFHARMIAKQQAEKAALQAEAQAKADAEAEVQAAEVARLKADQEKAQQEFREKVEQANKRNADERKSREEQARSVKEQREKAQQDVLQQLRAGLAGQGQMPAGAVGKALAPPPPAKGGPVNRLLWGKGGAAGDSKPQTSEWIPVTGGGGKAKAFGTPAPVGSFGNLAPIGSAPVGSFGTQAPVGSFGTPAPEIKVAKEGGNPPQVAKQALTSCAQTAQTPSQGLNTGNPNAGTMAPGMGMLSGMTGMGGMSGMGGMGNMAGLGGMMGMPGMDMMGMGGMGGMGSMAGMGGMGNMAGMMGMGGMGMMGMPGMGMGGMGMTGMGATGQNAGATGSTASPGNLGGGLLLPQPPSFKAGPAGQTPNELTVKASVKMPPMMGMTGSNGPASAPAMSGNWTPQLPPPAPGLATGSPMAGGQQQGVGFSKVPAFKAPPGQAA